VNEQQTKEYAGKTSQAETSPPRKIPRLRVKDHRRENVIVRFPRCLFGKKRTTAAGQRAMIVQYRTLMQQSRLIPF
jgi:hypothetical protein